MNPNSPVSLPAHRRGFTLIELLVVISIIGVIAGFTIVALKPIFKNKKISVAKGELAQLQAALDNYKAAYGVYPPSNQADNNFYLNSTPPTDRALFSQLYYELSGTTINGGNFVTLDGNVSISTSMSTTPPGGVNDAYGVGGFINCSKGNGEDTKQAKNFLPSLSSKQIYNGYTNNHTLTTMLVTSVGGPDDNYQPLKALGVNPIRYVYPGVQNPGGYDLWVQLVINGQTNLVCNWSKSALINTANP